MDMVISNKPVVNDKQLATVRLRYSHARCNASNQYVLVLLDK